MKDSQDAFGHDMYDYYLGKDSYEVVERDDGFISLSGGPEPYFSSYEDWPEYEKTAISFAQGKVLDIGCGAGRHTLYLQERGLKVTGVDNSPLAIKTCQERGVQDARVMPITRLSRALGIYDTLLMLGNNFALVGNPKRARWLLRRFYNMTSPSAVIIAQNRDPYQTDLPEHLAYHARNRTEGKMSGQILVRVRYKCYTTPWIAFLMLSTQEMEELIAGTGWLVRQWIDDESPAYAAIIEKDTRRE